jgi:hypothetical protein
MPLLLDRALRVAPFVRLDEAHKRCTILLVNNHLDATGTFEIILRMGCHILHEVHADGSLSVVPIHRTKTGIVAVVENIEPWQTLTILGE